MTKQSKEKRSFNSATALSPWKASRGRYDSELGGQLQFGHGTITVESGADTKILVNQLELQFGHGTITVESNATTTEEALNQWRLQFGHGTITVESTMSNHVMN